MEIQKTRRSRYHARIYGELVREREDPSSFDEMEEAVRDEQLGS